MPCGSSSGYDPGQSHEYGHQGVRVFVVLSLPETHLLARQCPKPIRYVGVSEGIDDLRPFVARDFVDAIFE
jgi:hypothetical protein